MTARDRRTAGTDDRLARAQRVAESVDRQGERVDSQVSLAHRLLEGWRRVHEENHLAQLFRDEGRIG